MNKQLEPDLVPNMKKYTARQVAMFNITEQKLMRAGMGFTKELAKSQGAQLIQNVKDIEFKDSNMSEKVFGRKMFGSIRDVFSFVLGEHVEEFISVNYPPSRFAELQAIAVSLSSKKVEELEKTVSGVVEEPKDNQYYTVLGTRAWNALVREVKAETASRKEKMAERKRAERAAKKAGLIVAEPEEDSFDESPLPGITEDDRELFMDGYLEQYLNARDDFANRRADMAKIAELKKEVAEETERYVVVNVIVDNIRSAMVTLTQKIKASVANVSKVHNKLTATVCLDSTGEYIANPFATSNLSGLCQILKNEYYTANIITFNRDFADVLSCPVTQTQLMANPLLAAVWTDKRISEWVSVDCWKFMTMDIFFVNILLGYLPNNAFKQKCVAEIFDFLQKMESDRSLGDESQSGVGSMPIYQHLVEFMRVQFESESYMSITAPKNQGNTSQKTPAQQQSQQKVGGGHGSYTPHRTYGNGVEMAASVSTLYTGEVTRDKNVSVRDAMTGTIFAYSATKEKCALCYGKPTGDKSLTPHAPRCFGGDCVHCKLFGHKSRSCMQDLAKQQSK